ncbi:MAG: hypothetical protein GY705_01425, partial [Bacteroidetes bacterium]|nr:hypothetical protein [Bacteroidota bacterium]
GSYNQLRSIRIDPAMEPIEMDIFSITLYFGNGTLFKVPLETLEPNDQVQEYSLSNGDLTFKTASGGNDPNFLLTSIKVDDVKVNLFDKITHYGIWFLGACLLTGLVRFFVTFFISGK